VSAIVVLSRVYCQFTIDVPVPQARSNMTVAVFCRYGHNGYEMINVTYQGDQLIAYKVTGDKVR
jgi:hypothetical protein